jgi:hypothetical protein
MLEKPKIQDEHIISHLQYEYNLSVLKLSFLLLGADLNTVVYRVLTDIATYFLKLRKGFDEITVRVPLFFRKRGVQEIIAHLEVKSQMH